MRLDEACERVFARHETFHPRYGWIKKAVDAASCEHDLFNSEDAVVEMGVGKNMVKSIKHWGLAFKALEPDLTTYKRRPKLQPSALGEAWFGQDGVDPFMELPGTHWWLHWLLLAPVSQAPVWWIAFNEFPAVEFAEDQLLQFVNDRVGEFGSPNQTSVKKDVGLVLRMYSSGHTARATFEERIDAPFRNLGLIQPSLHASEGFRFNIGPKPTLPAKVFAAAVLDFASRMDPRSRVVNLSRALAEPGSPGRAFKLTDDVVLDLLESAAADSDVLRMGASAGMPQLNLDCSPRDAVAGMLRRHYAEYGADLDWSPAQIEEVA